MKRIFRPLTIVFLLIGLTSCQALFGPNELEAIAVELDLETHGVTTPNKGYTARIEERDSGYVLTVTLSQRKSFSDDLAFYINGILIEEDFAITEDTLTFRFDDPEAFDPAALREVSVSLDPDGGYFPRSFVEEQEPDRVLTVTSFDDTLGTSFTLFDSSHTMLQWFYKLFVVYQEEADAYVIVAADPASTRIEDLDLPDYDFILAVHNQTQDEAALEAIKSYSSDFNANMMVLFDRDIGSYDGGEMEVSFYSDEQIHGIQRTTMKDPEALPVPIREEFRFAGWQRNGVVETEFPGFPMDENVKELSYVAEWESVTIADLDRLLAEAIPPTVTADIDLPQTYGHFAIDWTSSDPETIDHDGTYTKPYQATSILLTASISSPDGPVERRFTVEAHGYKSLSQPISSGYIYRNYDRVDDDFFATLDIVYTAFITAQDDGTLAGTNYLSNVQNHIMPGARAAGSWVVMSVGPGSSWSEIAASPTRIATFADSIVATINEHGFDGVDIDWETPAGSEKTRYTALMRAVHTKVKENNENHLVTTAITGGMWQPPNYDLENSAAYIDYINVMTYGMTSSGGQYQNALYRSNDYYDRDYRAGRTLTSCSIAESVDIFEDYGVEKSKLIIGLAFYGIEQRRSYDPVTETYGPWTNAGSVYYPQILDHYLESDDYRRVYDRNAGVPYIIKNDGTVFISYDDPRSIIEKADFVRAEGLGGLMFWEYGTDSTET
ncbi:MAG: glycosyl hydrolase family 18 protein, partial [Acholeplasmataceae bacterium]